MDKEPLSICHECGQPLKTTDEQRGFMRKLGAAAGLVLSSLYLFNPGAGIFELLPDNLPVVGNMDEIGATLLLLWSLEKLGLRVSPFVTKALTALRKRTP